MGGEACTKLSFKVIDNESLIANCSFKPVTFCEGPTVVDLNFCEGAMKLFFVLIGFHELLAQSLKFIVGIHEGS